MDKARMVHPSEGTIVYLNEVMQPNHQTGAYCHRDDLRE
jgi:hypothetical protein